MRQNSEKTSPRLASYGKHFGCQELTERERNGVVHVPVWSMKQQVMIGQLVSQVVFFSIFFRVGKQGNIFTLFSGQVNREKFTIQARSMFVKIMDCFLLPSSYSHLLYRSLEIEPTNISKPRIMGEKPKLRHRQSGMMYILHLHQNTKILDLK